MKKIVILIIMVFLITGCRAKYNIVINEDLSVVEEAKLTGTTDFFANYYKTTKTNVLKSFIDIYKETLDENNYQYELIEDDTPYVVLKRKYNDVDEYINNSKLFNNYFDEIKYTTDGNIKRIETVGYYGNETDNPERFDVKSLEITINCPYKVINHNAKSYDKQTNTFHYELNDTSNKIIFEYDSSVKFNPNEGLITKLIMCAVVLIVIWIVVIYLNKKNNKKK